MSEFLGIIESGSNLTTGGILGIVILLIAFGVLVPWRQVNRIIAERDAWHEAHRVSEAARSKLFEEQFKLLETIRLGGLLPAAKRQEASDASVVHPPNEGSVSSGGSDGIV